jgi:predicted nucleic acid-binding protein
VIYVDTCALLKLARHEEASDEFFDWLQERSDEVLVSSVLVEVELQRALRRIEPRALPRVPAILTNVTRIEFNAGIRAVAAAYPDPLLRSLDAVHLATAQDVVAKTGMFLDAFVTYDKRLITAAHTAGLKVEHPGARY